MKSLSHLIGVCAILMLAIAFTNCTTDSEVTQVSENELESEDISSSSNSEKAETKAKSSSSKKIEAKSSSSKKEEVKSSDSKKSSASKEDSKKDSSKSKSSSSVKKDSDKVSSSSKKEEAKSSSSAKKIHVPGMEDTHPPKEVVKPDSTKTPKDTSAAKDTIKTDTTTVVSEEDKDEKMEQLDPDEQKEIEELIENGDSTVTEIENPDKIDTDDLDFDNNEYYCKTPDGSWYRLKENKAKTFWKLVWDLAVYVFTGHHWYDFTNVCDEMYMRPKSR